MLVLSRKYDEKIRIGDDIIIHVVEVGRDRVRLAFTAPDHVQIHREEIYDEIKRGAAGGEKA